MDITSILEPITTLKENAETRKKYDYICLDLNSITELKTFIDNLQSSIPDNYIYIAPDDDYGLEKDTHITVFYGLLPSGKDDHSEDDQYLEIKEYIQDKYYKDLISLKIKGISVFDSSENYDVLKLDVESSDLQDIHNYIRENYKVEETHKDYSPHITIAYLKKDKYKEFISDNEDIFNKNILIDSVVYQFTDKQKFIIELTDF